MLTMPRSIQGWHNITNQPTNQPTHLLYRGTSGLVISPVWASLLLAIQTLTDCHPLNAVAQVFSQLFSLWEATAVTHVVRGHDPRCPHINMLLWIKYWRCLWRHNLRLVVCRLARFFPPNLLSLSQVILLYYTWNWMWMFKTKKEKRSFCSCCGHSARAIVFSFKNLHWL